MLVDDENDVVAMLKTGLEKHGLEVDAFTSPSVALSAYSADRHELLIIDIRMQEMSGIQLFREIRSIDANAKVLFLTAFEVQEKEWHLVLPNTDVQGFIKKPVLLAELIDAVERIKSTSMH